MIKWWVNKQPVWLTDRQLIRRLYEKTDKQYRGKDFRQARKDAYNIALDYHRKNRDLYYNVMSGALG